MGNVWREWTRIDDEGTTPFVQRGHLAIQVEQTYEWEDSRIPDAIPDSL